jgi:hypothetical protein
VIPGRGAGGEEYGEKEGEEKGENRSKKEKESSGDSEYRAHGDPAPVEIWNRGTKRGTRVAENKTH